MNITELVNKYQADLKSINRLSAQKLSRSVIRKTPVDSGSAQNSWTPAINEIKAENVNIRMGDVKRHNVSLVINDLQIGDDFYLTNAQPYIRWLEYMQRTVNGKVIYNNGQTGHMISRTRTEWQQIVNNAVKER